MELATFKQDVWGREVILGASWDLLWVLLAVTFVGIAIHAIIAAAQKKKAMPSAAGERIAVSYTHLTLPTILLV